MRVKNGRENKAIKSYILKLNEIEMGSEVLIWAQNKLFL